MKTIGRFLLCMTALLTTVNMDGAEQFVSFAGEGVLLNGDGPVKIYAGGDADTPFGSKAWVLVRMDGATEVINARYSRLKVIYKNMGFNAEALENKLQYLPTK